MIRPPRQLVFVAALGSAWVADAAAQRSLYEQFYFPAAHNWVFRRTYPDADRLFNAFDYGHAILYELLWRLPPDRARPALEEEQYRFLTTRLLRRPPALPLEEAAIAPEYAKLVPEAKLAFEWAHVLHRQAYDILADERLSPEEKDRAMAEVLRYYRSRRDLALSTRPKGMELMEGQPYSVAFRRAYPKFNGLIWAYHWLQIGLYEPLLQGRTPAERTRGVREAIGRFWQMLEDPPRSMPYVMPMTPAVAPTFAARYPEVAAVFDNLHSLHDVISDILVSDRVPRAQKRAEILRALRRYQDDTTAVMDVAAWQQMAVAMGVHNMGGPAWNILPTPPRPTVPLGATMEEIHAAGQEGAHAGHAMPAGGDSTAHAPALPAGATPHGGHGGMAHPSAPAARPADAADSAAAGHHAHERAPAARDTAAEALLRALRQDPIVRQRLRSSPTLRRAWDAFVRSRPEGEGASWALPPAPSRSSVRRAPAPPRRPAPARPTPPAKPSPPPQPHHHHPPS